MHAMRMCKGRAISRMGEKSWLRTGIHVHKRRMAANYHALFVYRCHYFAPASQTRQSECNKIVHDETQHGKLPLSSHLQV